MKNTKNVYIFSQEDMDAVLAEPVLSVFWGLDCFSSQQIKSTFEKQVELLVQANDGNSFVNLYMRGLAWLLFAMRGAIGEEVSKELESIPTISKYLREIDQMGSFKEAAKIGFQYFPCDELDIIGGTR
ncbi:hypothetical protein RGQ13_00690 [Thalassotalea psychrophila]|uniref:Uncharacterized protein n=1 Tax=Thalassotalea psychrophila TaxID=3065647 RepID=A0ABY9TW29_9GAMM|nr:hypothetical protein RGQ13_00690 [Colwelliaceae bacterium SQ149]